MKICLVCKNSFKKPRHCSSKNWNKVKYCSIKCSAKTKENKAIATCANCNKGYDKRPSHIKRNARNFCSMSCYANYREEKMQPHEQNTWKGGVTKENQRGRSTKRYRNWRAAVLQRDGGKCIVCGTTEKLEADHIKRWIDFPDLRYEVSNGRTLCVKHHSRKKINPELLTPKQ